MDEIRVRTNQIELQVREYKQQGEAIVFLHFGGSNLMAWQRVVPYFQERYHLVLVDLRGHGKSDEPESGYDTDNMARDVIGVMQYLGLERAHVVGSSLGAEVGLAMAAHYPEKVLSLVCDGAQYSEYGPYGIWEGSEAEFEAHVAAQLENIRDKPLAVFPSIDALVEERRQHFEKYGWWNTWLEAVERYGVRKIGEGEYIKAFGKQAGEKYMQHYFHCRFETYYPQVRCPLLMLAEKEIEDGREKTAIEGLAGLAAHGEIAYISGWAHPYLWLLDPQAGCEAVLKFLDAQKR